MDGMDKVSEQVNVGGQGGKMAVDGTPIGTQSGLNEQAVVRCLRVLTYLSPDFAVSASLLAADLGVTERTIRRDVALLRSAGYPVIATADGYLRDEGRKETLMRVLGLAS